MRGCKVGVLVVTVGVLVVKGVNHGGGGGRGDGLGSGA